MKNKLLAAACAAAALGPAAHAESFMDKVTWVPAVGVQMKTLSFDQDLKGGGSVLADNSGDFEADLPMLSVGLTAIYDRFYVSLKIDDRFDFDESSTKSDVPFTNDGAGGDGAPKTEVSVERRDYSLTFGMNVIDRLNVFVGYMDGKTEVKPDPHAVIDGTGTLLSENLAQQQQDAGLPSYEQEYQEEGWFLGASYGWPIRDIGTLSTSVAYAFMDGTYEDNFFKALAQDFEYEGDSEGASLGVTWSAPLTERVGYYLDLRYQRYDFDGDDDNGNFPGSSVDTEEEILTYAAGIQWYF